LRKAGEPGGQSTGVVCQNEDFTSGVLESGERHTTTAADGSYRFDNLLPGTYTVAEVMQAGWVQTYPGVSPARTVSLTGSTAVLSLPDELVRADVSADEVLSNTLAEHLTNLDAYRANADYAALNGAGVTTVVIDTGIDLNHSFFGPDTNADGIADRIVFQWDFAENDADASDRHGHGSNVSSLIASSDALARGVAPQADLIALKVFTDAGSGNFGDLEEALQWTLSHVDSYHIGVINMSLGDGENWADAASMYGIGDELAALAAHGVIIVAAAGNSYYEYSGQLGVAYPAADPAVVAAGAVWSGDFGGQYRYGSGAIDVSTGAGRIAAFSQRDDTQLDAFVPGTRMLGANATGGTVTMYGTSQASAYLAGIATLAQDVAQQYLHRNLTTGEFAALLASSGNTILDGDDENDNVANTGLSFSTLDMLALANAIRNLSTSGNGGGGGSTDDDPNVGLIAGPASHTVHVAAGEDIAERDFGNFRLGEISGTVFDDFDANGGYDPGISDSGLPEMTVFIDADGDGALDVDETSTTTGVGGAWRIAGVGPGTHRVTLLNPGGWTHTTANFFDVFMASGGSETRDFGVNQIPYAGDDSFVGDEDQAMVIDLARGDNDPDGPQRVVQVLNAPSFGNLVELGGGVFSYSPTADFNGEDSFTYQVFDGLATSNVATVRLTINAVNDAPVAVGEAYAFDEDVALEVLPNGVLANDTDVDGDSLSVILVSGVAHGALTLSADGGFTYTPDANYNGSDSFSYKVNDGSADSNVVTVNLTIGAVNDAPLAIEDAYAVDEDNTLSVSAANGVLTNDSDVDGDSLSVILVSNVVHGVLVLDADGGFAYTPDANYNGSDSFIYRVSDGVTISNDITVSLSIRPVNDAPVARDNSYSVARNGTLAVVAEGGVLANDSDVEGDALVAELVSEPAHGQLVLNADGSFTYTPDVGYSGTDSFVYAAKDGVDTSAATVFLNVGGGNNAPLAVADAYTVDEDGSLTVAANGVLGNDSDLDGDSLSAVLVSDVAHGVLTLSADGGFTYAPSANYHGSDSFSYKVNDGSADSNVVTVSLTINPVNDAPVAVEDAYTVDEDGRLLVPNPGVLGNDSDVDGDRLTLFMARDVAHGVLGLNAAGGFEYAPFWNYHGSDSFSYWTNDGSVDSNVVTVNLLINAVNDAPVAVNEAYTLDEDQTLDVLAAGVLRNDSDVDGDSLSAVLVSDVAHGALTLNADGSFTYVPSANYHGSDSFSYQAHDGSAASNVVTVSLTISAVNDMPRALDNSYSVAHNASLTVAVADGVLANDSDVDGDVLAAEVVSAPSHGQLVLNPDGSFSYTPDAGYSGADSFIYAATDGSATANATVFLSIGGGGNNAPVAAADAYTVDEDGSLTVAANGVLGNDVDVDGDSLSAVLVSDVAHGVLTLNADGGFSYAPSANYHGSDSFSYKANDGSDDSNVVTVELTVLPVTLRVTSFAPTDSGFRVEFNRAVEAHVLNLYGPGSSGDNDRPLAKGPADVTLQGSGSIGGVRGSLVLDDDRMGATFVRTNGVLAAGDYTLTLASRSDGWQDTSGHLLDGDGDGQGGGDYVQHFTVAGSSSAVLSAGEMMIGPGLALGIPGGAGVGLPITLSNAAGVTAVEFKLAYEPALLEISGVSLAAGVTGTVDWTSVPGVLSVSLTTSGLGAASSELLRILGTVPESARQYYGAKHVLDLFDVRLSAGGVAQSVRVDDGLHVNAYVADTNGSASYTTLDQQRLQRVISAYDSGFSAYPLVDPIVVADVNNSRNLTSADTLLLAREINWLTTGTASNNRSEIPDIPSGIGPFDFTGADPVVDIPRNLTAVAGGVVTVPVRLDTAAGLEAVQVQLAWNPELLELVGIRRGSLTGDFQYFVARQQAGELLVDMSRLEQMAGGQGSVLELEFRVAASAAGLVEVDLQWARLNDTHLTLNPAPLFGADPTDGAVFVANTGARPAEFSAFAAPDLSSGQPAAAQLSAVANSVVIDLAARYEGFAFARNGEGDRRWLAESLVDGSSASERREARAGKPMGKLAFLDKAVPVKSGVQLRR